MAGKVVQQSRIRAALNPPARTITKPGFRAKADRCSGSNGTDTPGIHRRKGPSPIASWRRSNALTRAKPVRITETGLAGSRPPHLQSQQHACVSLERALIIITGRISGSSGECRQISSPSTLGSIRSRIAASQPPFPAAPALWASPLHAQSGYPSSRRFKRATRQYRRHLRPTGFFFATVVARSFHARY